MLRLLAIAPAVFTGLLPACTTTTDPSSSTPSPERRRAIDTGVDDAMNRLYAEVPGADELASKAQGVLVFPSVIAAGFWVGGSYGEGALRMRGTTEGFYQTTSASLGLQLGVQSKALFFLFLTEPSLDEFRQSNGWSVGGKASVALLNVGANGALDTNTATASILAYVLTNNGLMANLTLEGTRISPLLI
ncbi:hypothetical protein ADM96_26300 [Burkholderia sp. ST111]|nr:hypothetical protein ADM96_26300 [Burkholderia sp. ST111]